MLFDRQDPPVTWTTRAREPFDRELAWSICLLALVLFLVFFASPYGSDLLVPFSPAVGFSAALAISAIRRRVNRSYLAWIVLLIVAAGLILVCCDALDSPQKRTWIVIYWRLLFGLL